jgi:hypothetical protein
MVRTLGNDDAGEPGHGGSLADGELGTKGEYCSPDSVP